MAIASVGAFCLRDYREAVMVVLLYQVGELFQSCAVSKSRKSISALMDIRPDSANLERDGAIEEVSPEEVKIGDIIVIRPGEKIPLDCTVEEGSSSVDTSSVTGESVPRDVNVGSALISGCVNISGLLRCRVTAEFGESTVSKILELVENAGEHKARAENFITRFARVYTPAVVGAAVLLAVIPSLFDGQWSEWISRALTFLVISCPCALEESLHCRASQKFLVRGFPKRPKAVTRRVLSRKQLGATVLSGGANTPRHTPQLRPDLLFLCSLRR